jgi:hypothetical protein
MRISKSNSAKRDSTTISKDNNQGDRAAKTQQMQQNPRTNQKKVESNAMNTNK